MGLQFFDAVVIQADALAAFAAGFTEAISVSVQLRHLARGAYRCQTE
jgi:hypothetical protein